MAESQYDDDGYDEESGASQAELLASYLAFARRSLKRRWKVALGAFSLVIGLTLAVTKLWPRTYHCETRFMAQQNLFAPRSGGGDALGGAAEVILRHESLADIIKQANLVKSWPLTRQPLLTFKDRVFNWLRGAPTEEELRRMLVGTLESKLSVSTTANTVTVAVDWQDPQVAVKILDAAVQNFLDSRHTAEISTIAEYVSILESHAAKSRDDIYKMSEQLQKLRNDRLAAAKKEAADRKEASPPPAAAVARRPSVRAAAPSDDDELARAKTLLESKQKAIAELESDRQHRVLALRGKLGELLAEYTPAHPQVVDTQRTLEALSQESPQVAALRGEVRDLEGELKRRTLGARLTDGPAEIGGGFPSLAPPSAADPLPTEIVTLANDDELDPAVTAQFRYAVSDYTRLRDAISYARVDLDTAQAAFSHRYKIVVPPEAPGKPAKPKIPVVIGAGIFAAILLGAIAAVIAELATGKMIERWQVNQMELPVLAELRFPPASE